MMRLLSMREGCISTRKKKKRGCILERMRRRSKKNRGEGLDESPREGQIFLRDKKKEPAGTIVQDFEESSVVANGGFQRVKKSSDNKVKRLLQRNNAKDEQQKACLRVSPSLAESKGKENTRLLF